MDLMEMNAKDADDQTRVKCEQVGSTVGFVLERKDIQSQSCFLFDRREHEDGEVKGIEWK